MLDLRYARAWLAVGWFLIVSTFVVCLVPAKELPATGISDKWEHTIAYSVLTLWFMGIYRRSRYLHVAGALVLMGVVIELLQGAMQLGRQCDILDVIANSSGVVLGVLIALVGFGGWAKWVEDWLPQ
jgi:VanZ family protein